MDRNYHCRTKIHGQSQAIPRRIISRKSIKPAIMYYRNSITSHVKVTLEPAPCAPNQMFRDGAGGLR